MYKLLCSHTELICMCKKNLLYAYTHFVCVQNLLYEYKKKSITHTHPFCVYKLFCKGTEPMLKKAGVAWQNWATVLNIWLSQFYILAASSLLTIRMIIYAYGIHPSARQPQMTLVTLSRSDAGQMKLHMPSEAVWHEDGCHMHFLARPIY